MKEFPKAEALLKRLEDAGFEAYYVGGCVRDHLMGRAVHDVDITTNALPEQTAAVFEGYKVQGPCTIPCAVLLSAAQK